MSAYRNGDPMQPVDDTLAREIERRFATHTAPIYHIRIGNHPLCDMGILATQYACSHISKESALRTLRQLNATGHNNAMIHHGECPLSQKPRTARSKR